MEPTTLIPIGAAAYFTKPYLEKIFGPTCEYLGGEIKAIIEKRIKNLTNILEKTEQHIDEKKINGGFISPRIINEFINQGSFIEDELIQNYFAGVLASSKNPNGDEGGLFYLDLIRKLSALDIKIHYVLYSALRKQYSSQKFSIKTTESRSDLIIYLPTSLFIGELGFSADTQLEIPKILDGLTRLNSLGLFNSFSIGSMEHIKQVYPLADSDGIVVLPSLLGAYLFLWAHGIGELDIDQILNPDLLIIRLSISHSQSLIIPDLTLDE